MRPRRTRRYGRTIVVLAVVLLLVLSPMGGTVAFTDTASAAPGDVLYRANAGGSIDGTTWDSSLQNYLVSGGDETASHGQPNAIDSSVPDGTSSQIWETERWDSGDAGDGDEMQYEFDVPSGQQVEVRLYFYDGCTCTDAVGERVFDVSVEGQTVLDNFDIIETYSDQTGAMESFTVTSDGTIDVDFAHVTENPQINAIEIVSAEPQPDTLGGPSSVDFGSVVTGNSGTETVTVTNLGASGDSDIDITGISITGTDAGDFSAGAVSQTTLAPGESADIPVTFTPTSVDPKSATLEVAHSGSNSPLTISLSGEGVSDVPVGFGSSQLDLSGVSVSSINNPTSLQFGPDGRLYVSQQDGTIYAFEVERTAENDYAATSAETITTIKNDIPNHNDDGDYNSQQIRQVTGITVTGTASQPVLYVSSSDWRIATGNTDPPSQSLDTNSGVISKLEQTSSGWDHTMLVRGLPRSEENHAPNGLALDEQNGVLYLAEGGHTNMGTPSNFFSGIPEYAYSGAILSIDLSEIESMSEKDAANTDVPYKYDLPTLAPGQTTTDGPFGGLDGDNMAVLEQDSPVQVYAPGFRNPYDVHLTQDGQLYSVDNGPNGGLGGPPTETCEVASQDSGTTYDDNLHYISGEGYYAGHPNPVRANADYFPGAVYDGYDGTGECEYLVPGQEDGALATFGASTNGLTEYTASNFGGAMQGDLLTSSFDGNVYRMQLNAQGDDLTESPTPLLSSGGTLDVTAQGDDGPFPGTVWSAERTDNAIQVFEPADYDGGGDTQCDLSDPTADADGDGYTNGDEQAVGTDPCSAASVPDDYDDDGNPDELDDDDDNDGLSDSTDPFALDPDNGQTTQLPVELDFSSTDTFANTIPATSGGTDGLGFTGLMTNGQDPYSDLYNPDNVFAGGQANLLSVDEVPQGDAYQDQNDQQYAFQFGADTSDVSQPFTVHTTVAGFPENPESAQSAGMFIGTGDQDNYLKFVVSATDGTGGVELAKETGGSFSNLEQPNDASVTGSETATDLFLTVDPTIDPLPDNGVDEYAVTATYTVNGGAEQTVGTTAAPAAWFTDSDQGLAVGVISTSNFASSTFSATWDQLSVQYAEGSLVADAGDDQTVDEGSTVTLDASGSSGDSLTYSWTQTTGPSVTLSDTSAAQPTFTAPEVDGETTLTFEVEVSDGSATDTDTVDVTVQDTDSAGEVVYTVNAGGSEYTAGDGTVYAADPTSALDTDGDSTPYSTSEWASSPPEIANTDDDPLYRTERYGTDFGYEIPVSESGTYEVTLKFAEIYQGAAPGDDDTDADQTGQRVFDVTTEGQTVLNNYDIYAEAGDSLTAVDETYTVEVTDGTLNVGFDATGDDAADNAKISAIKVVKTDSGGDNTPPTVDAIADQTVTEDETLDVSVSASDADSGDTPSLSLGSAPGFASITDAGDGTGTITLAPTAGAAADSPYTVEVVADDGTTTTTESFQVTVESAGTGGDGEVQYRVNVGGPGISVENGPDWSADTSSSVSQYLASPTPDGGQIPDAQPYTVGSVDASVPDGTPTQVFETERYDPDATPNMQWAFPVQQGATYEVRLHFHDGFTGTSEVGDRVFGVNIEGGEAELQNFDIIETYGDNTAATETFTVTPSDDTLNIEFLQDVENPQVNGIEVVKTADAPADTTSADVTVTPGTGIDSSTFGTGTFSVTNTGDTEISSVEIDVSESVIPDAVFDPDGTAGDELAKGLEIDSESGDGVGVVSTGDGDVFSEPHNGQDNAEGYDVLTLEFTDFQPGETVTFSTDMDPTTIKGASTTGGAGSISGLELSGSAVTVTSPSATVSNDLFTDGSAGGAQSSVGADAPTAPTLGVQDVTLQGTDFPNHGAATVSAQQQTLTLSGPAGATVELLTVEASTPPTDGYDVDAYEADSAEAVSSQTVTLDPNGEATVQVSLAETNLNYFQASVQDGSGATGAVSQTVVLEYDPDSGETENVVYRVNAGGPQVSASDGGPDWSADTDSSPSQYVNVDGDNGLQTFSTQDAITLDGSVPSGTPTSLFQTERWDADTDSSTADDTEMKWTFPVQQGETYEVRLYLAEIAFESGASSLPRTFDVTAEGDTKLNDYNIIQQYGHDTGAVETFTVTPSDGTIDLTFLHEQENPKVNAIEIVGPEPPAPDAETSAEVTVNGGSGDTDASTFNSGSFAVTNTGTEQIESVTFDLSSTAFPDVVFDPEGTAGDESGLCFTPDSGASETGLVSPNDPCSDPYSDPNNGQDGSDGYETLTIEFTDFDPGETFTFSADLDPNSIKGADSTQNSLAGPIGGNDMIGGTVTVESADATASNELFTDGSAGGAQSAVTADPAAAPSVTIDGESLESTTFGEHAAGAATVADAQQSVTVTGATPGETVTLLRIEGELNLDGVPDADDDGSPGYDIEEYEANRVLQIEEYSATADSNGEATFDVTLTDSSETGGLNYFVAAVGDSSQSGQVSQSVILEYAPDEGLSPVVGDDAPTDPDGDGKYEDVNGDGSVNVLDAQAIFSNTADPVVQNNVDAFDFNDDGEVNVLDAQALFANGEAV